LLQPLQRRKAGISVDVLESLPSRDFCQLPNATLQHLALCLGGPSVTDAGDPGFDVFRAYREALIPAGLANQHGPPVVIDPDEVIDYRFT